MQSTIPLNSAAPELTSAATGAALPEHLKFVSTMLPIALFQAMSVSFVSLLFSLILGLLPCGDAQDPLAHLHAASLVCMVCVHIQHLGSSLQAESAQIQG